MRKMETRMQKEQIMENSNTYGSGHIALAVFGGALVGAAVAFLVAPKSGQRTREQIGGYVETARDKAALVPEAIRSAGQAAMETMNEGKNGLDKKRHKRAKDSHA
jgi:gas vesicle protein